MTASRQPLIAWLTSTSFYYAAKKTTIIIGPFNPELDPCPPFHSYYKSQVFYSSAPLYSHHCITDVCTHYYDDIGVLTQEMKKELPKNPTEARQDLKKVDVQTGQNPFHFILSCNLFSEWPEWSVGGLKLSDYNQTGFIPKDDLNGKEEFKVITLSAYEKPRAITLAAHRATQLASIAKPIDALLAFYPYDEKDEAKDPQDIQLHLTDIMEKQDHQGNTPLHCAFQCVENLDQLQSLLFRLSKLKDLSKINLAKIYNNAGKTIFHLAAERKDSSQAIASLAHALGRPATSEAATLVDLKTGKTILHLVAERKDCKESIVELVKVISEAVSTTVKIVDKENGYNPLHILCLNPNVAEAKEAFDALVTLGFSGKEGALSTKVFLTTIDSAGCNALHLVCKNKAATSHQLVESVYSALSAHEKKDKAQPAESPDKGDFKSEKESASSSAYPSLDTPSKNLSTTETYTADYLPKNTWEEAFCTRSGRHWLPIHYACRSGHHEKVKLLLTGISQACIDQLSDVTKIEIMELTCKHGSKEMLAQIQEAFGSEVTHTIFNGTSKKQFENALQKNQEHKSDVVECKKMVESTSYLFTFYEMLLQYQNRKNLTAQQLKDSNVRIDHGVDCLVTCWNPRDELIFPATPAGARFTPYEYKLFGITLCKGKAKFSTAKEKLKDISRSLTQKQREEFVSFLQKKEGCPIATKMLAGIKTKLDKKAVLSAASLPSAPEAEGMPASAPGGP